MKLGFHYHIPATLKEDGKIYMPGYLGVFIDSLAFQVEVLVCFMHSPLDAELQQMDYALHAKNVTLYDIGPHASMHKRMFASHHYTNGLVPTLQTIDMLLIRGPSPLLPAFARQCSRISIPYAYLLVGDYLKSLRGTKGINPLKRFLLWSFYWRNKQLQDRYAKSALIFTNNKLMYDEYIEKQPNTNEIRTTTLSSKDFYQRDDTCQNNPIRLAFAGRIEPAKGIEDMLEALRILREMGVEAELHIAGWDPGKDNQYLDKLQKIAVDCGVSNQFHYHGRKTVGPDLFEFYRQCDIFLVASIGNEGFPRTIWEAMAQSMPVIATRVGSIPEILTDCESVILIDQNKPVEIANSVVQIKQDKALRQLLIRNGFQLAQANTLGFQSQVMIEIISKHIKSEGIRC